MNHALRTRTARHLAVLLLALSGLACRGCLSLTGGDTRGDGDLDLRRKRLFVIPFATRGPRGASYFKSTVGRYFSREVAGVIRACCPDADVRDADDLPDDLIDVEVVRESWMSIGERLKADYLLIGEIHELRGKEPRAIKLYKGTMRVAACVLSLKEEGKVVWRTRPTVCKFIYPRAMAGLEEIPADVPDAEAAMITVMRKAAIAIAVPFIGEEAATELRHKRGFK